MAQQVRKTLGDNIRQLRRKKRLSQQKLAQICSADRTTINEIENGHGNPTVKTLSAIADALGVSPATLFTTHSAIAEPPNSPSTPDPKLIEQWSPDKIIGLMIDLTNVDFVDPAIIKRSEMKNTNYPRVQCDSYEAAAEIINPIFGASIMDAAYWISGNPTRRFQRWCAEVGERSEQLLTALGYPILSLEEADAIGRDYSHRVAPPISQILRLLAITIAEAKKDKSADLLTSNLSAFSITRIPHPFQDSQEIVKYLHMLRIAGRLLPVIVENNKTNLRLQSAVGDALFFNIAAAYFMIYRVKPKMTDRERGHYAHGTGWAMRILKLGACRLRNALESGELKEHRANPWLGYLVSELTTGARLRRDTIARRMEEAWREVLAVDRGDSRLLPTRSKGFLGTNFYESPK